MESIGARTEGLERILIYMSLDFDRKAMHYCLSRFELHSCTGALGLKEVGIGHLRSVTNYTNIPIRNDKLLTNCTPDTPVGYEERTSGSGIEPCFSWLQTTPRGQSTFALWLCRPRV